MKILVLWIPKLNTKKGNFMGRLVVLPAYCVTLYYLCCLKYPKTDINQPLHKEILFVLITLRSYQVISLSKFYFILQKVDFLKINWIHCIFLKLRCVCVSINSLSLLQCTAVRVRAFTGSMEILTFYIFVDQSNHSIKFRLVYCLGWKKCQRSKFL